MIRREKPAVPEGSFALITGSSQGLGRALAEECASRGINLILAALPGTGLPQLAETLRRTCGIRVELMEVDLCAEDSAQRLFDWTRRMGLPVSVLINNAGLSLHGLFAESLLDQYETLIKLNVLALVRLTHLFLPELRRQARAFILNVASLAAFYPVPFKPVYAPSKSFVLNFSLTLREELRGSPVRVSVLCPGGLFTNQECRDLIAAQGLLGRISSHHPEQVAGAVIRDLFRGRAIIIPGMMNRLVRFLGTRVPSNLVLRVAAGRFRASRRLRGKSPPRLPGCRSPRRP